MVRSALLMGGWLAAVWLPFDVHGEDGQNAAPGGAGPSAVAPGIVLTEIHYHPPRPRGRSEFIEVLNASAAQADLSGWRFTRGVDFVFPDGYTLAPGARAVVCKDLEAFRAVFGKEAVVAGAYAGALDNAGDIIRFADAASRTITDVRYVDVPPWPRGADGEGLSLQRVRAERDADDPANWVAATPTPGSGRAGPEPEPVASLYAARHEPEEPRPGDMVEVSVRLRAVRPGLKVALRYQGRGRGGSLPMKEVEPAAGAAPDRDPELRAKLPPQLHGTLVRYWIEAIDAGVVAARTPDAGAPTPSFGYYVQNAVATKLPLYTLVIEPDALAAIQADPYSNDLRPAAFVVGREVFPHVGVRARGAWARSWNKKCLKVVFAKDRRPGKDRRINLNSAGRDVAFIREPLAYEIYRDCGALSLRSRPVRLHVNGDFWGLFVETEQPRKRWLERNDLEGATLYKAASRQNAADERAFSSPEEHQLHYTVEAGEQTHEELWKFCRALAGEADATRFFEAHVVVEQYVNYLCATALTQNWDGFNKNHFVARDAGGKWHVIPWDLDRTLGDHWKFSFGAAGLPSLLGTQRLPGPTGWNRLADRFLGVPALRERFQARMGQLLASVFTREKLWARIDSLAEAMAPEADMDRRKWRGSEPWRDAVEQVKRYVVERRAVLLRELPGGEARRPRNAQPAPGWSVDVDPVVLESSPFAPVDPGITHRGTRWQVREAHRGFETPLVDAHAEEELLRLSLPRGILFPRAMYFWRVAHIGSNGKASEPSAESSFTTGDFPLRTARLDLSGSFNRDLIANPGDRTNDFVDSRNGIFIVDGFDGQSRANPDAHGLPRDRVVGVHLLGDYAGPNALQLSPGDRDPIRIVVPPGAYSFVRFLVAGGGDSRLPVRFEYREGGARESTITCDDWYDDNPPEGQIGDLQPGVVPILDGMGRIRRGTFKERSDPALFEVTLAADASRTLVALTLLPEKGTFQAPDTTFNLFAATGIEVGAR